VRDRGGRLHRCQACAASWDRRARFCGTCGAPLLDTAPDPAARRAPRRWARRLGLAGAILLVGLATTTLGEDLAGQLLAHRPDPVVAMPDAGELVEREPSSPEERREALAPFDPNRTRCVPTGCELWRRPVADHVESPTVGGGNLAFIEHEEVVAVDVQTGAELWRSALPERPAGAASAAGMLGMRSVGGDERTVVVANEWGVRLLSRAGEIRWETVFDTPQSYVGVASVTEEVVVLAEEDLSIPAITEDEGSTEVWQESLQRLTVFDARTGLLRWRSDPFPQVFLGISGDLLTAFDGEGVRWIDAGSGQMVSSLPTGDQARQHTWVEQVGDLYLVNTWLPDDVGRAWVVDDRDLDVLAELEGAIAAAVEVDDRVVLLLFRDSGRGPVEREAVAVGSDGAIRWHLPLDPGTRHSCCPSAIGLEGGLVRLGDGDGVEPVVIDVTSGALHDHDPLASLASAAGTELWPFGPGLIMQRTGAQASVIHDHRGRLLTVHGGAWPVHLDDRVPPDTPILLMGDQELVAVHFPP
jgi:hypothetical protein